MTREFKVTDVTGAEGIDSIPYPPEDAEFIQRMRERNLRYAEWRRRREALARRPSARLRRFASRWFSLFRWGVGDWIVKVGEWVRG